MAQSLDKSKNDHLLVVRVEPRERFANLFLVQPRLNGFDDVDPNFLGLCHLVERRQRTLATIVIDDQVVRQSIQPGRKWRASWLVPIDRLPGLQENLLGQILRFARRSDAVKDVAIDPIEMELV